MKLGRNGTLYRIMVSFFYWSFLGFFGIGFNLWAWVGYFILWGDMTLIDDSLWENDRKEA